MGLLKFRRHREKGDGKIPVTEVHYVVIDTELTGLNEKRDSIVSIAAIRMVGGRINFENPFNRLVNPETELTADSVIIHGITPSEVIKKPAIESVLSEFIRYCESDVIVGHCVSIDIAFINREMKRIFRKTLTNQIIDTSAVYNWIRKKFSFSSKKPFPCSFAGSSLYEIAKHFGVPVSGAHTAIMDAFITAQIFQRFIPMLVDGGVENLIDLLRIGNPSKGGDGDGLSSEMCNL